MISVFYVKKADLLQFLCKSANQKKTQSTFWCLILIGLTGQNIHRVVVVFFPVTSYTMFMLSVVCLGVLFLLGSDIVPAKWHRPFVTFLPAFKLHCLVSVCGQRLMLYTSHPRSKCPIGVTVDMFTDCWTCWREELADMSCCSQGGPLRIPAKYKTPGSDIETKEHFYYKAVRVAYEKML
jgi:hypothetical protein